MNRKSHGAKAGSGRIERAALAGSLLLSCFIGAGQGQAQSLEEALVLAFEAHPLMGSARQELLATIESLPQAQSQLWRPQVTVTADHTYTFAKVRDVVAEATTLTDENTFEMEYGYEVDIPLFDASVLGNIDVARANIRQGVADYAISEQKLFTTVLTAYADVLLNRRVVSLRAAEVADLEREAGVTRAMVAAQRRTRGDLAAILEQLAETRANLATSKGDLAAAEAAFEGAVGRRPADLDPWPSLRGMPLTLDDALDVARLESPSVRKAEEGVSAGRAKVDAETGQMLPTLDFVHEYIYDRTHTYYDGGSTHYDEDETTSEWLFELNVSLPLYQGGLVHSEVREAKRSLGKARMDLSVSQRQVVQDTRSAWSRLEAAREATGLAEERLLAATEAEGIRAEELRQRRIDVEDFLTTRAKRLDADIALVQARHTEMVQAGTLLSAMGRLTARGQELDVVPYDPAEDIRRADGRWFGLE